MSINTSSSAFRKIDVDLYNEDNYHEDPEALNEADLGVDENQITSLLTQGKNVDALKLLLTNAPLGNKHQATRMAALNLTIRVLLSFKASQVDAAISQLNNVQIDVLMKFIYKGMEVPQDNSSGQLLMWHEKVFAVGGLGSIIRVMTDKKGL